jgi:peptide/nickel transport system substrate-binding protein
MMEFEANPNYFRGKPGIERVVLKFVGEKAGVTELLSGNVDVISYTNPTRIPKLANDPRFRVYYWLYVGVAQAIYWQNDHPLFQDPRVRRALTLAINRRELLQLLSLPEDLPLFDGIYTPRLFRRGELAEPLPHDPARARALLDAAGWRDENGDGVREREGKEARPTAIVADLPGFQEMAIYVQNQLRQVGVRMGIRVLENTIVNERVRDGEFEVAFAPFRHEPRWLNNRFGKDSPIGYTNAEVAALIGRAMVTTEPDEMDRIYRELMEIFRRDVPVTFLHPVIRTFIAHRRLRGLSTPFRADPLRFMEHLWLEEED